MLKSTHTVVLLVTNEGAMADAIRPYDEVPSNPRFVWVFANDTDASPALANPNNTPWCSIGVEPTHRLYKDITAWLGLPVPLSRALAYMNNEKAIDPAVLRNAGA